jgi:hypothetical protein
MQNSTSAKRWATMWEVPKCTLAEADTPASASGLLLQAHGIRAECVRHEVMHYQVTRFKIEHTLVVCNFTGGRIKAKEYAATAWVAVDDLDAYPMSAPLKRHIQRVLAQRER